MVVDKSGSLAGVKRHDYLPFGEELSVGVGGRAQAQGYGVNDNVRQKFTDKERDNETSLDFFETRYYSSTQGRLTSTDPLYYTGTRPGDPQQFNLYNYVRGNPLSFTDPDGKDLVGASQRGSDMVPLTEEDRAKLQAELRRLAPGTRVDANGVVHKPGLFRRMLNHVTGHGAGTSLVSRLVDSKETTGVMVTKHTGSITFKGEDLNDNITINGVKPAALVVWGAGKLQDAPVRVSDSNGRITDTGPIQDKGALLAIALGHELIHAAHIIDGTYIDDTTSHNFRVGNTTYQEARGFDEFRTIGFAGFVRRGDITENQLRRELGQPPRAAVSGRRTWRVVN